MGDDALREELRALRDIEEIKRLKAHYCRCVDTKDWATWREMLTDDFRLESEAGINEGADVVISMVSGALGSATTVHHVHAPEITHAGPDRATGIWAMEDWVSLEMNGAPLTIHGAGHYHEEYVRTADGWRVKSSVLRRLRIEQVVGT